MKDMHPTLQQVHDLLTSATAGMTPEDWHRHPEGKWSAAQVMEHLTLTYTGTSYALRKCLAAGQPSATRPSLRQRLITFWVVGRGHFPRGIEAPAHVRPKGGPEGKSVSEALEQLAAMDAVISECEQRFGPKTKVLNHPILGPFTTPEWRRFHRLHAQHHVPQIQRLRTK
jgi:hypothetical protein